MNSPQTKRRSILRHLGPVVSRYWPQYAGGIIVLGAVDVVQTIIPDITARVIDELAAFKAGPRELGAAMFQIGLLVVVMTVGRYLWRYLLWGSARRVEERMRHDLFAKFMSLSAEYHDRNKTGDLMALVTNDLEAVREALGDGLLMISDFVIMTTFTLIAMFHFNHSLTLMALIPLALIALIVTRSGPVVFRLFKRVQDAFSSLSDYVQEAMTGIRVIKVFTREDAATRGLTSKSIEIERRNIRLVTVWGLTFPLIDFLGAVATLILLWAGGLLVTRGEFSIGGLVAFNTYVGMLAWPMLALGWAINLFQRGQASLVRINEVLDLQPTIVERPEARTLDSMLGEVEFDHVVFEREGRRILNDVSFHAAPGEKIGIIGPVGSGKTTIVSLLTRAYDTTSGRVLVDGIDVRDYQLKELRRAIGVVTQDVFLFSDSLEENINVSDLPVGTEDIQEATRLSGVYKNIMEFQDEFGTVVGERGVTLSGGEKQRVTIARAILKKPRVLVLDDALSAVDAGTEKHILENIASFETKPTTIVISNRISALRYMDKVLVLKDGRVAEQGSHAELLRAKGMYWHIFRRQLVERKVEKE